MFVIGPGIADTPIIYYIEIPAKESGISYTYPTSVGQQENAHFTTLAEHDQGHYMNIISIEEHTFTQATGVPKKGIELVRLSSAADLVLAAIKKSTQTESLCSLYTFSDGGKTFISGFDLIEELSDDTRILYYAEAKGLGDAKFARYKYSENKVDFTDFVGEHSYMYAKIIPLAEPFSFFKMPD